MEHILPMANLELNPSPFTPRPNVHVQELEKHNSKSMLRSQTLNMLDVDYKINYNTKSMNREEKHLQLKALEFIYIILIPLLRGLCGKIIIFPYYWEGN